jgi:hypothetical protein
LMLQSPDQDRPLKQVNKEGRLVTRLSLFTLSETYCD